MKFKCGYKLSIATAVVVLGIGIDTSLTAFGATFYSVMDLGNLGNSYLTTVTDINNIGQVVGNSTVSAITPDQVVLRAFRTSPNSPINPATDNLGTLGGFVSVAKGINDIGQVVGASLPDGIIYLEAFLTAPNSPINPTEDRLRLGGLDSNAAAINNEGVVVATKSIKFVGTNSYRIPPNRPVDSLTDNIGSLSGNSHLPFPAIYTEATDINDIGQIVGTSRLPNGETRAFRTAPNQAIVPETDNLGTLGGSYSRATAINNLGQVVGFSLNANGETHAFRTAPNQPIVPSTDDLGTLGGVSSRASDINNLGQVVGESLNASGETRAFLYDNGLMFDLNNLIPISDFTLNYASGINDKGQIVAGFSGDNNLNNRIFLLTPVDSSSIPEPTSILGMLSVLGIFKAVNYHKFRRSSKTR
ncbi:MAG: HAF repeat-containing protein [Calothrix sp. C42_A2020_038]|nr:HAF repeat-containing protein [Calothrix sp. C42_A2020_038]